MNAKQSKRRRAEKRGEKARADRRDRMAAIIEALGLWGDFRRSLPARLREWFLDLRAPRPVVELADRLGGDRRSEAIRKGLEAVLRRATFPCPMLGERLPVDDYFRLVKPLADCIAGAAASPRIGRPVAFLDRGRKAAEVLRSRETGALAVAAVLRAVGFALLPHDRIDGRVHCLAIEGGRTDHGRWVLRLVLDATAPERIAVEIDGVSRPATRVPCSRPDGIDWVDWDPGVVGLPSGSGRLPVYVQAHALRAVSERLSRISGGDWLMYQHLCHSLAEPRVARRDGPDHLVEFRLRDAKVGYLACRLVRGVVIVRTFLFLTMDGTPEGEALRRGLRLARDDKRHLGLDGLHAFLSTDLTADPRLAALLAGFGCGDLVELGRQTEEFARRVGSGAARGLGHAEFVGKYLGLAAPPGAESTAGPRGEGVGGAG